METDTFVKALDAAQKPQDNLIRLSTGVVLRGKQAPPLTLMLVMSAFPRPKPPTWSNPAFGNREMENPDDPDYQERIKEWKTEQSNVMTLALITTGTEFVSKPADLPGPQDDEWVDEYSLLGLPMHLENKSWRYLTWVQFKAATSADDIARIMEVVGRLSGVPNSAVKTAEDFPGSDQKSR
jgi:hypothetical protein